MQGQRVKLILSFVHMVSSLCERMSSVKCKYLARIVRHNIHVSGEESLPRPPHSLSMQET